MVGERGSEGVNYGLPLKLEGSMALRGGTLRGIEGPSSLRASLVAMVGVLDYT